MKVQIRHFIIDFQTTLRNTGTNHRNLCFHKYFQYFSFFKAF